MFNPAMLESMKHMMNGNMMKQSAEMMSKMSDEELKSYSKMTGMSIDPSTIRRASASMASMDEPTLENMKNQAPNFASHPAFQNIPPSSVPSSASVQPSKALEYKNKGNDKFKAGDFTEAGKLYKLGIQEIENSPLDPGTKDLEISLRMNLSACLVKEERFEDIIEQCKKTLILEPNTKALYRYGQALYKQGKVSQAVDYLERAARQSPDDLAISNLLEEARQSLTAQAKNSAPASEPNPKPEGKSASQASPAKPAKPSKVEEVPASPEPAKPVIQDQPKNRGVDLDISAPVRAEKPKETIKEKVEKVERVERPAQPAQPAPQTALNPNGLNLPNLSQEQMSKGLDDLKNMSPDSIKQMAQQLKSMDPRLMQEVFKSQGINMPPEQIAKMADMLTPETINMMTSTFAGRQAPGSGPTNPTESNSNQSAPQMPNMASMLNNPEMIKMASQMLAQQLGKKPEDVETILGCLGKLMKVFGKVVEVYMFFMKGNRKWVSISGGVLLFSYWMGYV